MRFVHDASVRRLVLGVVHGVGRRGPVAAEAGPVAYGHRPDPERQDQRLAVPAILGWEGPVVAASVKTDLVAATPWVAPQMRRGCGFDPSGVTGLRREPVVTTADGGHLAWGAPGGADLTEVAREGHHVGRRGVLVRHGREAAGAVAVRGRGGGRAMRDVVRWVDTQEVDEVLDVLEAAGVPEALQAARASWGRDERQRSAVYTTAETVLEPFADPALHRARGRSRIRRDRPSRPCSSGPTPSTSARPPTTSAGSGRSSAAWSRTCSRPPSAVGDSGAPLDPPLLVVLDETANIAPLAELDGLAATCAGHGIQLVTVWQDLAQIAARYGTRSATVVNNHRAKLFLSGIADPGTLDHASQLVGDEEVLVPSVTQDIARRRGRPPRPRSTAGCCRPTRCAGSRPAQGALVYGSLPRSGSHFDRGGRTRSWWRGGEGPGATVALGSVAAPTPGRGRGGRYTGG